MRRAYSAIASAIFVLVAFGCGTAFGAYYHQELMVVYRAYGDAQDIDSNSDVTTQNTTTPEAQQNQERHSTLILPTLEEPVPLVYSDTLEEERIQEYLKEGAVVLPLGTTFGEPGNVVVTAHSSGTAIFGPFRFAFAKLGELKEGDEFQVKTSTAVYTYRVYDSEIVWPHEVDKLPSDERTTLTLVTCWPLWTNFKRLLVHSELMHVDYRI